MAAVLLACLIAAGAGCRSSARAHDPLDTVRQYVRALEEDQPAAAYALLEDKQRRAMSLEELTRLWRATEPERRAHAKALRDALERPGSAAAELAYPGGDRLKLTWHSGRWMLEEQPGAAPIARTPEQVLRVFAQALERRNIEEVMDLLAPSAREGLERAAGERVSKLRAALESNPAIEVSGDRARLRYGSRFHIELVRDGETWKILDLN